jgi:radical SAM protein with 4Fe4S-binding SPASM domain
MGRATIALARRPKKKRREKGEVRSTPEYCPHPGWWRKGRLPHSTRLHIRGSLQGTRKTSWFIDYMIRGSLREKSLGELLSPENTRLKLFLLPKRLRRSKCSMCSFKEHCGGGGRNRVLSLTGDFWGYDPTCIVD